MRVNIDISDSELYFEITTYYIFIYTNMHSVDWIFLHVAKLWENCQIFLKLILILKKKKKIFSPEEGERGTYLHSSNKSFMMFSLHISIVS